MPEPSNGQNPFLYNGKPVRKGAADQRKVDKYILMENIRSRLESDRSPYDQLNTEIQQLLDPHMVIQNLYEAGYPDFVTDLFLTSKHLSAFDILDAGMQEGLIPMSQLWSRYGLLDEESPLMEKPNVWDYLHQASRQAHAVLLKSNFYQEAPATIRSWTRFQTGAILMERDPITTVRFTSFPIGSYYISNNYRGVVDTFCRVFRMRVRQVVEEFCTGEHGEIYYDRMSEALELQWRDKRRHEEWVDIVCLMFPNPEYDYYKSQYDSKYAKYSINYYEMGRNIGFPQLREEGLNYFPVYCPRWFRQPTDSYGVDGPGTKARAPIRRLFKSIQMWLLSAEKMLQPPIGADPSVGGGISKNGVSMSPNFLTSVPGGPSADKKIGPIYELNPAMLNPIKEYIAECQAEIDEITYKNLFQRFGNDERKTPFTATETLQRVQEDARILATVFGRANFDWLQPMMTDLYWIMVEDRAIPPAPPELHGTPMKVEVISRIAIALKQGDINALTAGYGLATQIAQAKAQPGNERLNADEALDYGFRLLNLNPKLLYSPAEVAKIRAHMAQMQAKQQAAAQLETTSKAAKNLAGAPTGGDTLLNKIMENGGVNA